MLTDREEKIEVSKVQHLPDFHNAGEAWEAAHAKGCRRRSGRRPAIAPPGTKVLFQKERQSHVTPFLTLFFSFVSLSLLVSLVYKIQRQLLAEA